MRESRSKARRNSRPASQESISLMDAWNQVCLIAADGSVDPHRFPRAVIEDLRSLVEDGKRFRSLADVVVNDRPEFEAAMRDFPGRPADIHAFRARLDAAAKKVLT